MPLECGTARPDLCMVQLQASPENALPELRPISAEQRKAGIPVPKTVGGLLLTRPASASANIGSVLDLAGPLNIPALRASHLMLIERHEALRTIYKPQGGGHPMLMMVQVAAEACQWFREAEAADEAEAREIAAAAWGGEYDLEKGPLMRLQVTSS